MAVSLSSIIFIGFPVRFHWPVSCQSNLSPDATERSIDIRTMDIYEQVFTLEINYVCTDFIGDSITKITSNKGRGPKA